MAILADITNEEDIKRIAEESPCLDGLVNNAGISIIKPIAFFSDKDLNKVFETNTFAPMLLTKWLLKKKKIVNGASLVFTASIASFLSSLGHGIYGTSKAALTSYVKYCARELALFIQGW